MQTIVVASQKGGTGKTLLSCALAVEAAQSRRVALFDADPQRGTTRWAERRNGVAGPELQSWRDLRRAVQAASRRFDLAIVDTPPQVTVEIARAVQLADLVLIPVQPSVDDVDAAAETVALAKHYRKRILFVLNRVKPRVAMTADAQAVLAAAAPVAPILVHDRVLHAEARISGLSAGELVPSSKASLEMRELWLHVASWLK